MKELNLCEILKGCEGGIFYSPICGNLILNKITNDEILLRAISDLTFSFRFNKDGTYYTFGEIMIFPSEDQRDWNKWLEKQNLKVPKTWSKMVAQDKETICLVEIDEMGVTTAKTPIEKSALALLKIHQLIEAGYGGNVTNEEWVSSNGNNLIYVPFYNPIEKEFQSFGIYGLHRKSLIAFHTRKQIKKFLSKPENVQLLKDYSMI